MMRHSGERVGQQADQYSLFEALDTGLFRGAMLLTLDGEIPVDYLSVGDTLITRDTGISKVRHIQRVDRQVQIVSFTTGSLGDTRPVTRTLIPADQMVLIRDWRVRAFFESGRALVAARALVDDEFITIIGAADMTLYQIFCDGPHILYSNGLELSTADGARTRGAVLRAA